FDAFVTRVMQCACGFRVAATARSIGCWALPSKAAVWSARWSESPPAFGALQYPFVRSCARASCKEYRAAVFVLPERDRENAQVTTSDLPDAHADHPRCLLMWARMLNPVLCRCGHGRREWPTTSFLPPRKCRS